MKQGSVKTTGMHLSLIQLQYSRSVVYLSGVGNCLSVNRVLHPSVFPLPINKKETNKTSISNRQQIESLANVFDRSTVLKMKTFLHSPN